MSKYDNPIKNLKIASPCSADWNAMRGDARKRFCSECKLNVYNLSGMTRYDAEHLLRLSEGKLCVRYFQRPDGTILTQDCPVGWARVKQRVSIFAAAAFSLIVSLFASLHFVSLFGNRPDFGRRFPMPFATPTPNYPLMGAIPMPSPTPKTMPTPSPVMGEVTIGKVVASEPSRSSSL
ncbi:MAG: hypothetical protein ABI857_08915 [Acidobacteriota bacterium]